MLIIRMEVHGRINGGLRIILFRVLKVTTIKPAILLQANFDASASPSILIPPRASGLTTL
jgi:hypothetical protein